MKQPFSIIPSAGLISGGGLRKPPGSWSKLLNMKLSNFGAYLEQTYHFYRFDGLGNTWNTGDYYDRVTAGIVSETGSEKPMLLVSINGNITAFFKTGIHSQFKRNCYRQIAYPTTRVGLTGGCMAVFTLQSQVTLGQKLEVEIDGATTFKWRINGGAYTTLVPITLEEIGLGANGINLYFLADSGFTIGDRWEWLRDDCLFETQITGVGDIVNTFQWPNITVGETMYFLDYHGRLMKYNFATTIAMSAGYQPIFGTDIAFYERHLFVLNYQVNTITTGRFGTLGCSDLDDLDNFIATDLNEADTYSDVFQGRPYVAENHEETAGFIKLRYIFVLEGVLYVVTGNTLFWTTYGGLGAQAPFNFKARFPFVIESNDIAWRRALVTSDGVYLVGEGGIFFFSGSGMTLVSNDISAFFRGFSTNLYGRLRYGVYDKARHEAYFWFQSTSPFGSYGYFVYQELTKTWYFRTAHFDNGEGHCALFRAGLMFVSATFGVNRDSDHIEGNSKIEDANGGVSFQEPTVESQDLDFAHVDIVKDVEPIYLETEYTSEVTADYETTGILVQTSARKKYADGLAWSAGKTWVLADDDGLKGERAKGRIFRFRITPQAAAFKLPGDFKLHELKVYIHGIPEVKK